MTTAAAKADAGVPLTAVIARRADGVAVLLEQDPRHAGRLLEHVIDDSADHALALFARLKKSKGEGGKYSHASVFLLANSRRGKAKFV